MNRMVKILVLLMIIAGEVHSQSVEETRSYLKSIGMRLPEVDFSKITALSFEKNELYSGVQITDESIRHLKHFNQLELLDLRRTGITDRGLEHIGKMESIKNLLLSGTGITDSGIPHLLGMKNLEVLQLINTAITDGGLKDLYKLESLTHLLLEGTQITDEGVKYLKRIKNIKLIYVNLTGVTSAGVAELKEAFPDAVIAP